MIRQILVGKLLKVFQFQSLLKRSKFLFSLNITQILKNQFQEPVIQTFQMYMKMHLRFLWGAVYFLCVVFLYV